MLCKASCCILCLISRYINRWRGFSSPIIKLRDISRKNSHSDWDISFYSSSVSSKRNNDFNIYLQGNIYFNMSIINPILCHFCFYVRLNITDSRKPNRYLWVQDFQVTRYLLPALKEHNKQFRPHHFLIHPFQFPHLSAIRGQ